MPNVGFHRSERAILLPVRLRRKRLPERFHFNGVPYRRARSVRLHITNGLSGDA